MATSNRGTCGRCGSRCTGNYCAACARDKRHGIDDYGTESADALPHKCTQCGTEYTTDGSADCPDCGSSRRRYAGEI
jgi:hypothetical protein